MKKWRDNLIKSRGEHTEPVQIKNATVMYSSLCDLNVANTFIHDLTTCTVKEIVQHCAKHALFSCKEEINITLVCVH